MATKGDPPDETNNLGDEAPSYRDQARFVRAFRSFIKNPANRNGKGLPWTPAVILERLWELWPERSEEPGAYKQFCARNYKCFERLRSKESKQAVDDVLQLTLIQRFLIAEGINIPPPSFLRSLEDFSRTISTLIPPSRHLPDRSGDYAPGVRVYALTDREGRKNDFLGLYLPRQPVACCPAVIFRMPNIDSRVGLYFFASMECYTRDTDFTKSSYLTHCLFPESEKGSAFTLRDVRQGYLPLMYLSDELLAEPRYPLLEFERMISYSRINVICQRVNDPQALEFAVEYFKNLAF